MIEAERNRSVFENMSSRILAIVFVTCVLLSMTNGALILHPKCRCTTMWKTPIQPEKIQKFEPLAPGPHCKDLQMIVTLKFKNVVQICVNPNDKWVQDALKKVELLKNSTDTKP